MIRVFIPDPDPDFLPIPDPYPGAQILDPGVKKARILDLRSWIWLRNTRAYGFALAVGGIVGY
jgi:hypothetical protein